MRLPISAAVTVYVLKLYKGLKVDGLKGRKLRRIELNEDWLQCCREDEEVAQRAQLDPRDGGKGGGEGERKQCTSALLDDPGRLHAGIIDVTRHWSWSHHHAVARTIGRRVTGA